MLEAISFFLIIPALIALFRLVATKSHYEKIISFYFISLNLIILIVASSKIDKIFDIIAISMLFQLVAILVLIKSSQEK